MKMNFNLTQTTYAAAKEKSGIYLMIFPNGKCYLGSSTHVKTRLMEHFLSIYRNSPDDTHWYCELHDYLEENYNNINAFFSKTHFFVQYTPDTKAARLLEKQALTEIYQNKKEGKYYNTVYYYFNGEKYKKITITAKRWKYNHMKIEDLI